MPDSAGRFFEDFRLGEELVHGGGRTITEGDTAVYLSLTGDRYHLYSDAEFARSLGYEREIANDLLVFHIVFGKTVPDVSLNAVANLGYADVHWRAPAYPGDTLHATSTVIGLKQNSNGKTGNVYVRTVGTNQQGKSVLEYVRWVMVHKRNAEAPAPETTIPDLPDECNIAEIAAPIVHAGTRESSEVSPAFEDYVIGNRIHHHAGTTLTETEHASATRLYQNTAKVHFDANAARDGKRIVYGGHVISVARSLAYTGFETALRILAWNSGTHANPVYAGDTIYAMTDVVDAVAIDDHVGALRLRLYAVKNEDPSRVPTFEVRSNAIDGGRPKWHPKVALELDHWISVPRRGTSSG